MSNLINGSQLWKISHGIYANKQKNTLNKGYNKFIHKIAKTLDLP